MLSKLGKLLLFLYLGVISLKSLPKELFEEQSKSARVMSYVMILGINLFMITSTLWLLLQLI
jgi:hypothetical protein